MATSTAMIAGMALLNCIYCKADVDPTRGEGDHIIPGAFGLFDDELIFRRICTSCNNKIGVCEQQLIRCAPEAYFSRKLNPTIARNKRGKAWKGAGGMPAPRSHMDYEDHHALVEPTIDDPDKVRPVDQIVVKDSEGTEEYIRVFADMPSSALGRKLQALKLKPPLRFFVHVKEEIYEVILDKVKELYPSMGVTQRPSQDAGIHVVICRIEFKVTIDYWRAIAKIGFHYYLLHSQRGQLGSEDEFAGVRQFIMEGGDKTPFFTNPIAGFEVPFGVLPNGRALLPSKWGHVLATTESNEGAMTMVILFIGPDNPPEIHRITFARWRKLIQLPPKSVAHSYVYNTDPQTGPSAGRVFKMATWLSR